MATFCLENAWFLAKNDDFLGAGIHDAGKSMRFHAHRRFSPEVGIVEE
jgi:uncharacterized protein involved in copper resistance